MADEECIGIEKSDYREVLLLARAFLELELTVPTIEDALNGISERTQQPRSTAAAFNTALRNCNGVRHVNLSTCVVERKIRILAQRSCPLDPYRI
jgi:hypothetical protein